jgi:hypothetical protein
MERQNRHWVASRKSHTAALPDNSTVHTSWVVNAMVFPSSMPAGHVSRTATEERMATGNTPSPTPASRFKQHILDHLRPLAVAAVGFLKLDRDVVAETAREPPPLAWALGLVLVSAASWGAGFHSWRMVLVRPTLVLLWLFLATALARREGGHGSFLLLLRAFSVVMVVDVVAILGPLGQMLVVLVTFWWVVILGAVLEEQHDLGGTPATRAAIKAFVAALGILLVVAMVDAGIRGRNKWGSGDDVPQGAARPQD